jgi:regulator of protease activity HflC (stomatin/prohibitin superfamily)
MKQSRNRLAERARSEGKAEAKNIRSLAKLKSRRILDYAEGYAQGRRSEAELAVAKYVEVFASDEDFAIFLEKLRAMKIYLNKFVTVYMSSDELMTPQSTLKSPGKP